MFGLPKTASNRRGEVRKTVWETVSDKSVRPTENRFRRVARRFWKEIVG